jgi:hypothetical protein
MRRKEKIKERKTKDLRGSAICLRPQERVRLYSVSLKFWVTI